jgi:hypothetical protein
MWGEVTGRHIEPLCRLCLEAGRSDRGLFERGVPTGARTHNSDSELKSNLRCRFLGHECEVPECPHLRRCWRHSGREAGIG